MKKYLRLSENIEKDIEALEKLFNDMEDDYIEDDYEEEKE